MVSGSTPAMGKEKRLPVSGPITLLLQDPALSIVGELKDVSLSGLRVEHTCSGLKPGTVVRIRQANLEESPRCTGYGTLASGSNQGFCTWKLI